MAKYSASFPRKIIGHPFLYVVANRSEAVFYEEDLRHPFHFIRRVSNPKGRRHESALISDRQGRVASSSSGPKLRHALEPKMSKHEANAIRFAQRISREIDSIRRKLPVEGIVLVAEPHFLGLLRSGLASPTKRLVKFEVHREYAQGSDRKTQSRIRNAILREKKLSKTA